MNNIIRRTGILAALPIVFFLSCAHGQAPLVEIIQEEVNPASQSVLLDFRFPGTVNPPAVVSASARILDAGAGAPQSSGGTPVVALPQQGAESVQSGAKVAYTRWKDTGQTAAYIFLVETSDASGDDIVIKPGGAFSSREVKLVNRNATVSAFSRLLAEVARSRPAPVFGLYTFSDTLEKRVAVGQSVIDFNNQALLLGSLDTDQKSRSVMLYKSLQAAIEDLAAYKADRKAIILLGSGRTNDSPPHTAVRVAQLASANRVSIHTIGISEAAAEDSFLQFFQRLSEETGGAFQRVVKTGDSVFIPAKTADSLLAGVESGGHLRVEFPTAQRGKTSYEIALTLEDGATSRIPARQINLSADMTAAGLRVEEESSGLPAVNLPGEPLKLGESAARNERRYTVDFRFRDAVDVEKVEWAGEKPAEGAALPQVDYVPWKDTRQTSAYFFLIDVSSQARDGGDDPGPAIFRGTVSRLLDENPGMRDFGLATVGAEYSEIARLGAASVKRLSEQLADDTTGGKRGSQCNLLGAATKAIEQLATSSAGRKVLVILGSGRADDGDGSISSVRRLANEKNVIIQTVGFNPDNGSALKILRDLSDATQGTYAEVRYEGGARRALLPKGFFARFYWCVENGGRATVTFSPTARERQAVVLNLLLSGGTTARLVGELPPAAEGSTPASGPSLSFWDKYSVHICIAGVVALVLVIAGVVFFVRARRRSKQIIVSHESPDMPPPPDITQLAQTGATAEALAWLEMMDSSRQRHAVDRPAFRVGRNPANDLVLNNDSVSGFHAEILRSRDGRFTITDLDSSNGILVNGRRVESARLENNDIMELGEAKLRFLSNT